MSNKIRVSKDDEFFIAICNFHEHSYVSLGIERPGGYLILASFGKYFVDPDKNEKTCLWYTSHLSSALFSYVDGTISNERVIARERYNKEKVEMYYPSKSKIYYKAYGISYQHYLDFLSYMAEVSCDHEKSGNDPLVAFFPIGEEEDSIILELRELGGLEDKSHFKEHHSLNLFNTCRHTAIKLLQKARGEDNLGLGISSNFLIKPPLSTTCGHGRITKQQYFFILPLPPTAFPQICEEKRRILITLYKRMDEMIQIGKKSPLTVDKFKELKKLYQEIANRLPEDILEVIASIENWETQHKKLISTPRRWYWFTYATATEKMFDNFHVQFASIKAAKQAEENYSDIEFSL